MILIALFLRPRHLSVLPSHAAAGLITAYQKYLSPLKGFSCAHRVLHCGESCSQYVKRTILERGLSDAWPESRQRFRDCRSAYLTIMASRNDGEEESDGSGRSKHNSVNNHNAGSSGCTLPDLGDVACCVADAIDVSACDAGACDAGACDAGALDCGGCDVGSC
jgi:putative component of membrane protein insertase Oxa1/YidC/SpoIIIJ protein YidD